MTRSLPRRGSGFAETSEDTEPPLSLDRVRRQRYICLYPFSTTVEVIDGPSPDARRARRPDADGARGGDREMRPDGCPDLPRPDRQDAVRKLPAQHRSPTIGPDRT